MTLKKRVEEGAAFLDFIYGKAWRKKVKLRTLDLGGLHSCILGQTDSDFCSHKEELGLDEEDIVQFGFDVSGLSDLFPPSAYHKLTEAWKRHLRGD